MEPENINNIEHIARLQLDEIINNSIRCKSIEDKEIIYKAFEVAMEAHKEDRRVSGEHYIMHPLAVARIVSKEIQLGPTGIAAALLHDVVEDTDYKIEDIRNIFGDKIASIVDGLTKLEGVFDQTQSKQAENFRKLLLTMVEDIRVILIKLADRLHNMRTLDSLPEHKRLKIAGETLFIYAPLAQRLGYFWMKSELEDLSFKHEHPKIYKEISDKIKANRYKNDMLINRFSLPISNKLIDEGFDFDITGRTKSIYSIWTKMQKKQVPLDEIYDFLACRIVFKPKPGIPEKTQCWAIYSIITDIYNPKPDRLRDWVSVPKANGYEALHFTVMGIDGRWFEIQVRSDRMNEIAERGLAMHWKYKGNADQYQSSKFEEWLKNLREVLDDPESDSLEILDDFKKILFGSEISIFTPKGDIKIMPAGSTALDLAFEIHTNVGFKCIGAKVNYKLVPLNHELTSGDQVEILTSEKQSPKYEWLNYVVTAKAKTRIKEAFRKERKDIVQIGENKLQEALNQKKLTINSKILNKLHKHYNIDNKDELYFQIGKNTVNLDNLQEILSDKTQKKWIRYWRLSFGQDENKTILPISKGKKKHLDLSDKDQEQYQIAQCCNPIPGDDVVGYRNNLDKIILHSRNCPVAIRLMSSKGDNIVSANWKSEKIESYLALITLSGIDQVGIVSRITKVISDEKEVNMRSIHFESHDGIFEGTIYLYIHNTEDLNNLINKITAIKGVYNVTRQDRINEK